MPNTIALSILLSLFNIESTSNDEEKMRLYLLKALAKLKAETKVDEKGNILAFIKGNSEETPIVLNAHMDTVDLARKPTVVIEGDWIFSEDSALGSDDKTGIAAILASIEYLQFKEINHRDIYIVFTVAEEIGLCGSKDMDLGEIPKNALFYTIDMGRRVGSATISSPSKANIDIIVSGKSMHSMNVKKGINAIVKAAKIVSEISKIEFCDDSVLNIGIINGGVATNVVPDKTKISLEVRSFYEDVMFSMIEKIKEIAKDEEVTVEYNYKGYTKELSSPSLGLFKETCNKLNIEYSEVKTLGGSDVNNFTLVGYDALLLSAGYENPHSKDERQSISQFIQLVDIVISMMRI